MPNWIELPVNPPNARKIQIHNLSAGTTYEFQVIGINEYGDGMMSQIVEARTKGKTEPGCVGTVVIFLVRILCRLKQLISKFSSQLTIILQTYCLYFYTV